MNIQFALNPPKNIKDLIYKGLRRFNQTHLPYEEISNFACFAESEMGDIVGGLTGEALFNKTLFIEFFWIEESSRDTGVGTMLMEKVEQQAESMGIKGLYLDTYSFQALPFYLKLGFEEVGRYKNFPVDGVDKIFLQKKLN